MTEKKIKLKDGSEIVLKLSDEWDEITFYSTNGVKLPGEFRFIEDDYKPDKYLLARMYAPCKQQGIGKQVLSFFIEETDGSIWTRMPDGIVRNDGSHLTEDAIAFVFKMQDKGLIESWEDGYESEFYDEY